MTVIFRRFALPSLVMACLAPALGQAACVTTVGSLYGWYSLLVSGATTASTPQPKYLAGAVYFNGAGGLAADNVYSGAGAVSSATGAYSLNADCTVTLSLTLGSSTAQTYTVALTQYNEAVGIETDASAVASIDLQAQYSTYTSALLFNSSSLNGTVAASCVGPASLSSDLNIVTFNNGSMKGTDPYNNDGTFAVSDNPYSGSYTVNSDGTFAGTLTVSGAQFAFYGVISKSGTKLQYIYSAVSGGAPTAAFAACTGRAAAPIAY